MSMTRKWENEVLNYLFGATAMTIPASLYVGLHVGGSAPNNDGTGIVEPTGGGYTRATIVRNTTNFPASTAGEVKNSAVVTFPQASADWGTVTHFVIYDALTNGNAVVVGTITTPKAVLSGDTPSFGANTLSLKLA
jgi:hypothetical protein